MRAAAFAWPLNGRPTIRVAGRFPLHPDSNQIRYRSSTAVALHLHDYTCHAQIDRQWFDIQPGDLTLTPVRAVSQFVLPVPGFHFCIHFFTGKPATPGTTRLRTHFRLGAATAHATDRLQRIIEFHRLSGALYEAAAATALQELLLWLATWERRERLALAPRSLEALDHVHRLLDQQFRQPVRIAALAREAGLSQSYLGRSFRKRFGMTIGRYVLLRRIELARQLLATTRLPIKAVAAEVGIADPQYFNKQFHRIAGASPTTVRLVAQVKQHNPS